MQGNQPRSPAQKATVDHSTTILSGHYYWMGKIVTNTDKNILENSY